MTTIVAHDTGSSIWLGWDSLMVLENEKSETTADKVVVNNGVIYGVAGTHRALDLIAYGDLPAYEGGDRKRWIVRELVPALRDLMKEEPGVADEDSIMLFGVIVVVGGEVFQSDGLLSFTQNREGVYTIGSGGDYAKAVLVGGGTVGEALEVAAKIDPYTGGHLHLALDKWMLLRHEEDLASREEPKPAPSQEEDHLGLGLGSYLLVRVDDTLDIPTS